MVDGRNQGPGIRAQNLLVDACNWSLDQLTGNLRPLKAEAGLITKGEIFATMN